MEGERRPAEARALCPWPENHRQSELVWTGPEVVRTFLRVETSAYTVHVRLVDRHRDHGQRRGGQARAETRPVVLVVPQRPKANAGGICRRNARRQIHLVA